MNRISSKRGFAPRPANPAPFGRIPLLAACLLALLGLVQNALAHDHPGYSHDPQVKTHNPHWMSRLPDGVRMRQLSVPGTHDTMALHGGKVGNLAITQTMSLANQLESGIRAFDFRVGQIGDKFFLFHGFVDQDAELGQDVLGVMLNFLRANPGEALFMRLKWECYDPTPILEGKEKKNILHCYDKSPIGTREEVLDGYLNVYGEAANSGIGIWNFTGDTNPALRDLRGKIFIYHNSFDIQKKTQNTIGIKIGTLNMGGDCHLVTLVYTSKTTTIFSNSGTCMI